MFSTGSEVICDADGIPRPVSRWESINSTGSNVMWGLHAANNENLRSFPISYSDFQSPGVQRFRCRASQYMTGRKPIEISKDFAFIVTLDVPPISRYQIVRPPQRVNISGPIGFSCDEMPDAPGCASRTSRGPFVLVLLITSSVVVCVVFIAVVFFVTFRCRRHPFVRHVHRMAFADARHRSRPPQYAESDRPRRPIVVTSEPPNVLLGGRRLFSQIPQIPMNNRFMPLAIVEALLTPPDYETSTQNDISFFPPSYDTIVASKGDSDTDINVEEHELQELHSELLTAVNGADLNDAHNDSNVQVESLTLNQPIRNEADSV